jgi:hypothetical protein
MDIDRNVVQHPEIDGLEPAAVLLAERANLREDPLMQGVSLRQEVGEGGAHEEPEGCAGLGHAIATLSGFSVASWFSMSQSFPMTWPSDRRHRRRRELYVPRIR